MGENAGIITMKGNPLTLKGAAFAGKGGICRG